MYASATSAAVRGAIRIRAEQQDEYCVPHLRSGFIGPKVGIGRSPTGVPIPAWQREDEVRARPWHLRVKKRLWCAPRYC